MILRKHPHAAELAIAEDVLGPRAIDAVEMAYQESPFAFTVNTRSSWEWSKEGVRLRVYCNRGSRGVAYILLTPEELADTDAALRGVVRELCSKLPLHLRDRY